MANVTVLGAGGATVTIALSSQANADAAQLAVKQINTNTLAGIVDTQVWSGKGTLPAPQNFLGGAIVGGTTDGPAGNVGALQPQYASLMVNATGNSTVIGPQNFNSTVVAGDSSNLTYGNVSQNGRIFFGDGTDVLLNFAGSASVTAGKGTYIALTEKGATTTINPNSGAVVLTSDLGGTSGATTINAPVGGNVTVAAAGASTTATTINATSGNLFALSVDKGSALINPGAANVTVVGGLSSTGGPTGADYGGRVTLFGGSGSAVIADGQGEFTGGTAGNNTMFSSTVAGSATLTGGGTGDLLVAQGSGQLVIAGAGNETLYARSAHGDGANTFIVGNGFTTVFGGGQGGNTYIFSGLGAAEVDGRNEAAAGTASQNTYFNFDVDGNDSTGGTFFISDFQTGKDVLQISKNDSATVTFFTPGQSGSPMGSIGGTQVKVSSGATYNFFDSKQDIFSSDIQKV